MEQQPQKTVSITVKISRSAREKLRRLKGIYGCRTLDNTVTASIGEIVVSDVMTKMVEEEKKNEISDKLPEIMSQDDVEISDNLFVHIKSLILKASQKRRDEKYYDFDPDAITADSVQEDIKKIIPSLFDPYALLSKDEMEMMIFGVTVRNKFKAKTMFEFHDLIKDGLIKVIYKDYRDKKGDEF